MLPTKREERMTKEELLKLQEQLLKSSRKRNLLNTASASGNAPSSSASRNGAIKLNHLSNPSSAGELDERFKSHLMLTQRIVRRLTQSNVSALMENEAHHSAMGRARPLPSTPLSTRLSVRKPIETPSLNEVAFTCLRESNALLQRRRMSLAQTAPFQPFNANRVPVESSQEVARSLASFHSRRLSTAFSSTNEMLGKELAQRRLTTTALAFDHGQPVERESFKRPVTPVFKGPLDSRGLIDGRSKVLHSRRVSPLRTIEPLALAEREWRLRVLEREIFPSAPPTRPASVGEEEEEEQQQQHVSNLRSVRFDAQGNIAGTDVGPSEPPAYTSDELRQMTTPCSSHSQRVTAVRVVTNVMANALKGQFSGLLESSALARLMHANGMAVLKLFIRSDEPALLVACLHFVETLLWRPTEEELLDDLLECCGGLAQPFLEPLGRSSTSLPFDDELPQDLVGALAGMGFFERLDSLFQFNVLNLSMPVGSAGRVKCPLSTVMCNVLCRMARHSQWMCSKIVSCKCLFNVLLDTFSSDASARAVDDHFPQASVLRLVRLLCASSEAVARKLVAERHLAAVIARFVHSDADHPQRPVPLEVANQALLECFRLWRLLLNYHLMVEDVARSLDTLYDSTKLTVELFKGNVQLSSRTTHFALVRLRVTIALLESYVIVGDKTLRHAQKLTNYRQLLQIVFYHFSKAYAKLRLQGVDSNAHSLLAGALLNFLATCVHFDLPDAIVGEQAVLKLAVGQFSSCLSSFKRHLMAQSLLREQLEGVREPDVPGLCPALGAHLMVNCKGELSPFPVLASWYRLLYHDGACRASTLAQEDSGQLLSAYLDQWNAYDLPARADHFAKFELYLLYYVLMNGFDWCRSFNVFNALHYYQVGHEALYERHLRLAFAVSCPPRPLRALRPLLHVNAVTEAGQGVPTSHQLLKMAEAYMEEIGACLVDEFRAASGLGEATQCRQLHHLAGFLDRDQQVALQSHCLRHSCEPLNDTPFWYLEPVRRLRAKRQALLVGNGREEEEQETRLVIGCLLLAYRFVLVNFVDAGAVYCYALILFMTGHFQQPMVHNLLSAIYRDFLKSKLVRCVPPWPGETFSKLHSCLLEAFGGNGVFADSLCAKYALLPLDHPPLASECQRGVEENAATVKMFRRLLAEG